ncbi:conserved hypothetical protein [Ricinus communis]|uniref:Uncharacterized protein n=1 Tax=Ricinus communis TaxID=3988 RepID=B9T1G9_RICCO|nr:conserved hypothetical protein [Ricinus communis]
MVNENVGGNIIGSISPTAERGLQKASGGSDHCLRPWMHAPRHERRITKKGSVSDPGSSHDSMEKMMNTSRFNILANLEQDQDIYGKGKS